MLHKLEQWLKKLDNVLSNPQSAFIAHAQGPKFISDYLVDFIWCSGETYTKVNIHFDESSERFFYFNGEQEYLDTYYIKEAGWSSDNKYLKVGTPDFMFWIKPQDYPAFMYALNRARTRFFAYKRQEQQNLLRFISVHCEPFSPDPVTDECVHCFVVGTKSDISRHVTNSDKVIQAIADICAERGGKYFKGEAKTAKCVILLAPSHRNKSDFEKYKSAGYIIVMPEDFLQYFGKSNVYSRAVSDNDFNSYISSLKNEKILRYDYSL